MSDEQSYRLQNLRGLVNGDYMLMPFEEYESLRAELRETKVALGLAHDTEEVLVAELDGANSLVDVLKSIANDGCGCVRIVKDGVGTRSLCCSDLHPKDPSEWCWSCIARRALDGEEVSDE